MSWVQTVSHYQPGESGSQCASCLGSKLPHIISLVNLAVSVTHVLGLNCLTLSACRLWQSVCLMSWVQTASHYLPGESGSQCDSCLGSKLPHISQDDNTTLEYLVLEMTVLPILKLC